MTPFTIIEPSNFVFEGITSKNGKHHAGFTSNFNSNDAAAVWLREHARNNDFAQSLCQGWTKHKTKGWTFSPVQSFWLHRLATPEAKPKTPQIEIDTSGIADLLAASEKNLKSPKFIISSPDGKTEIKVAKATARSKFHGSFTVASPVFGEAFFGTLKDGKFSPTRQATDEVIDLINDFAADPAGVAASHGHRTGNCCFCNRKLTTAESTAVGYGATCAANFGLPWGKKGGKG
tara:strand:+ start:33 stop:731 length:699 start_codon:yes stop_codon:yes gene_type:complete